MITLAAVLLFSSSAGKDSGRLARNDALVMQLLAAAGIHPLPKARARTIHATICRINAFTWITPASHNVFFDSGAWNGRKIALFQNEAWWI